MLAKIFTITFFFTIEVPLQRFGTRSQNHIIRTYQVNDGGIFEVSTQTRQYE